MISDQLEVQRQLNDMQNDYSTQLMAVIELQYKVSLSSFSESIKNRKHLVLDEDQLGHCAPAVASTATICLLIMVLIIFGLANPSEVRKLRISVLD